MNKFSYNWMLKNTRFEKNKGCVFSCFAGGGGSSLGYKLAGFDVIGFNEVNPKIAACYIQNLKPQLSFIEPIQKFRKRKNLPKQLFELDILDGSPPCSPFSMLGARERFWGIEKKQREGNITQKLDTLFFEFIKLAKRLQPKIIIAENVTGILKSSAMKYTQKILKELNKIGYATHHQILHAHRMGVPQRRNRVFFFALRNDLCEKIKGCRLNFTTSLPYIDLNFQELCIKFKNIRSKKPGNIRSKKPGENNSANKKYLKHKRITDTSIANIIERLGKKRSHFSHLIVHENKVCPTITASNYMYRHFDNEPFSDIDYIKASSFPIDYKFNAVKPAYICGMSIPPVMMANISFQIHKYWLNKM